MGKREEEQSGDQSERLYNYDHFTTDWDNYFEV
jgi:actin-related protein